MTVALSVAIVIWSCAAAIILGYLMLVLTSRHGDTAWLAVFTAVLVVFGGVTLASEGSPWIIGGFVLVTIQCTILYLMWRMWMTRARAQAGKELTS